MSVASVSTSTGSAETGSPLRSPTLLAFLMVTVLLLGGAVSTVAIRQILRESPQREPAGLLRGQFPLAPAVGWTLTADQVAPGGAFVLPESMANYYRVPGLLDLGELLVTSVYRSRDARSATLVALDAATGQVRWTADGGTQPSCADALVDGLVACATDKQVRFYRAEDGVIEHSHDVASPVSRIGVLEGDVITAGFPVITRGNPRDLDARWHTTFERPTDDDEQCLGSGDSVSFGVTTEFVWYGSTGSVVLDAHSGRRVHDRQLYSPTSQPGSGGLVAGICNGLADAQDGVLTPDGRLRVLPGDGWVREVLAVPADDTGPYVAGRHVYARDGRELWTLPETTVTVAGDLVIGTDNRGIQRAYRRADGTAMWEVGKIGDLVAVDSERAIFDDQEKITAIDLTTGRQVWQIAADGKLRRAGTGMAVTSASTITFLPPTEQRADTGAITRCTQSPKLTPVEYRSGSSGLVVKVEIQAACPGGDIISTDAMKISVSEQNRPIAAAVFDFSTAPLVLPRNESGSATLIREFTFPPGSFWRLPASLGPVNSSNTPVTVSQAGVGHVVQCEDQGVSRGPASATEASPKTQSAPIPAVRPAEMPGDQQARALEALRAQADADRPFVEAGLANRWVAQLSSKQPGITVPDVDGRMIDWTDAEILAQHLRLRLQYPEVRLVWSNEWRTFDLQGWWVTIAGVTFPGPDEANGWCDARAIPVNECFAKLVSNTREPAGTTKYRR